MDEETKQLIDYLVDGYYRDAYLIGTEADESEYLADIEEEDNETWYNDEGSNTRYDNLYLDIVFN